MNDLNKKRIEGVKAEQKYRAAWDAVFGDEKTEIILVKGAGWDDNEKCECNKNIKYCKYPNCASG